MAKKKKKIDLSERQGWSPLTIDLLPSFPLVRKSAASGLESEHGTGRAILSSHVSDKHPLPELLRPPLRISVSGKVDLYLAM